MKKQPDSDSSLLSRLKELEELNQFFKVALDEAAIVAITDPNGKITYVNEMFCKISGYTEAELLGQDHRILKSGKMPHEFFVDMWKTISSGHRWTGRICNRAKGGNEYWVDTTIIPHQNAAGKVVKFIAIRRDVTQEVLAHDSLKKKSIETDNFFAVSPNPVCVAGMDGYLKRVNPAFVKTLGYSQDELLSQPYISLIHPDDVEKTMAEMKNLADGITTIRFENRFRHQDGTYRVLSWACAPDRDAGLLYAAARDVTDQRKKQSELEKITLDLDNAVKRAEQATAAKSNFLSAMSHEIRTPLNGILGMTSILMDSQLTVDQTEIAATIAQSGKTLLMLINDILDFSKIEAGKMELELVECDLAGFIREFLRPFRFAADQKGLSMVIDLGPCPHRLFVDQGRIGQILSNLISNAIKFTKAGKVVVKVQFESQGDSALCTILVQDTGVGIPESAKERMFEAFSQADQSISRKFGGTGLGLSITKRLVELMRGKISFSSVHGQGTVFKVEVSLKTGKPIADSPFNSVSDQTNPQILSGLSQKPKSTLLSGRILVAEDNQTNQLVIGRMLGKWGLKCHFVANGNEALDALREATYDLILMDCQMPELDGYEATRIIRKSDTLPSHIPIIALTANVGQGDEEKCIQAGMNSYLAKPVDRGLLEKALISFLSSQKSLINQATLAQFDELQMEGQPDILIEIIESFLKTSPKRVDQIVSFLESGDFEGSAREAHSLKSSANTLGAEELGKLCQRIEDRAELDDNAIVRSRIQSLQQLYSRSKAELIEIRAKRMSGSENPAA